MASKFSNIDALFDRDFFPRSDFFHGRFGLFKEFLCRLNGNFYVFHFHASRSVASLYPIVRKCSIGSNQHSAISGQLNTFQPKVYKTDIGEIYIDVLNSLAEC